MTGQIAYRGRSGVYGAFTVRNPTGKILGSVAALVLFWSCCQWSHHIAGPVGWAEKGLYLRTGWDAKVDPMLRGVPLLKLGRAELYQVIVERVAGSPLYTNSAQRAERPWVVTHSALSSEVLHRYLELYVYDGNFARCFWPVWLLWPLLAVTCLVTGQVADMKRLKKARQSGVHLRGNRMVGLTEWNRRSNEEVAQ